MTQQASQPLSTSPLSSEELRLIDAWWRACNYLSVGMIYLKDNPLPIRTSSKAHRFVQGLEVEVRAAHEADPPAS